MKLLLVDYEFLFGGGGGLGGVGRYGGRRGVVGERAVFESGLQSSVGCPGWFGVGQQWFFVRSVCWDGRQGESQDVLVWVKVTFSGQRWRVGSRLKQ